MGKELKKSSRTAKSSKLSQSKSRKSIGFDNEKYLKEQTTYILDRIKQFDNKLYLEFGGKILYDNHASRVLPGYDRQVKLNLLKELKEKAEVILCISAGAIEQGKIRADFGITYEDYIFRMIDEMKSCGLGIASVVITRFSGQPSANIFRTKLDRRKIRVYIHKPIKNYPKDIDLIVSDKGYGQNDYIKTTKPLAIVAGPGPGSGKLATCLSQLYHEFNKGMKSGYAKFETFPVWNLPLNHPINFAYEASTADIGDYNVIDKFHRKAYQIDAINYNRDIEAFPVVKRIMEQIMGKDHAYKSPTDMGVNRLKAGIVNDDIVRDAAEQEIIRRYYKYSCEYYAGLTGQKTLERMKKILEKAGLNLEQRKVGEAARKALSDAKSTSKDNTV
ncbi:MAG: DUF1846 family protein, partial [Patescibacteria group bacterium]|nr:DUF1846 family protein [Patescibacteria group bacterium]